MSFGKRLNQILLDRGMTAAQLSKMLGWNTGVLSQYMNNPDRDPRLSTAVKIADALDVSLDFLAGREPPHPPGAQPALDVYEADLVSSYRQLTPERKAGLLQSARDGAAMSKSVPERGAAASEGVA